MSVNYLITLRNHEATISSVMAAVLAEREQTGGRILLYDDHSQDRSIQLVEGKLVGQRDVAQLIRGTTYRGLGFATSTLIGLTEEPLTRIIDASDVVVRGSTGHMIRHLHENELGFIHGRSTEFGANDQHLDKQPFAHCYALDKPVRRILRKAIAGTSPIVFSTDALRQTAPLPEWVHRTQDFLISLRVAYKGTRMGYLHDVVTISPPQKEPQERPLGLATMFAELSRDVAHDGFKLDLKDLRFAAQRFAGRAQKYFRREGQTQLGWSERWSLWRWNRVSYGASRSECIARLAQMAEWLERDRDSALAEMTA